MKTKFYSIKALFLFVLLTVGIGKLNAQSIVKTVQNLSTGGDGASASRDNFLSYTITISMPGDQSSLASELTDNIPAGTAYVPGSTTLNGVLVADVNGAMPFASPHEIHSILAPAGILDFSSITVLKFRVKVTANGGVVNNQCILTGTNGGNPYSKGSNQTTTNITTDAACNVFYMVTAAAQGDNSGTDLSAPYYIVKQLNPNDGTATATLYNGLTGPCFDVAGTGSVLTTDQLLTNTSAMAYDRTSQRLYFVNNATNAPSILCYLNLTNPAQVSAYRHVNYYLETKTGAGYNVTRMTYGSDGKFYAITDNGRDLINFTINSSNQPAILRMGALVNDAANGSFDVLSETGGDIFFDAAGNLYLVPNSGNVYRINPDPASKIATYIGTINGMPARGCNSVAIDALGNILIGGNYEDVYKVTLTNMTATLVNSSNANVWTNGDFASCGLPIQPLRVATNAKPIVNNPVVASTNEVIAKVQPNPFHSELNLQVQLNATQKVQVKLIDFFGRTVYTTSEKIAAGVNSLHLSVPANLGAGIYVVELWTGDKRILQKKLVKQ